MIVGPSDLSIGDDRWIVRRVGDVAGTADSPTKTVSGVIVADARCDAEAALATVAGLDARIQQGESAILVVADPRSASLSHAFYEAGATHFIVEGRQNIDDALDYAYRHVVRLAEAREPVDRRLPARRGLTRAAEWIDVHGGDGAGVLLVGLSRFDIVNAAYGRDAGDALLAGVEARIASVARDVVGSKVAVIRLEGSAFALIASDGAALLRAAGRLDDALTRPFEVEKHVATLGVRFGVVERRHKESAQLLLRRATAALDAAQLSDAATMGVAETRSEFELDRLAVDLHRAMELDEIELRYQPQVDMTTGLIAGVEALARWEHGEMGALGADVLFAAAERADLGVALSDHIQQRALAGARRWPGTLNHLRMSLNLTAADVSRPGFAQLFLRRVDDSGFPRNRLTLEITETGLIRNLGAAAALLGELRTSGCRVALDDFGTGYSSLAYLKALPLDYLKIDKSLSVDVVGSARDRVVVSGVVAIARGLGLTVIAEGVETEEQRDLLAAQGCGLYQGFLRAAPLAEDALIAMVGAEGSPA